MVYSGYGSVHSGKSILKMYCVYFVIYNIDKIDYNIDTMNRTGLLSEHIFLISFIIISYYLILLGSIYTE